LAEQLLAAVVHLHNHRIVHRDIKADNVMIRTTRESDGAMEFILIDFGCALDCQKYDFDGFRMPYPMPMSKGGAPGFLAPEVARAEAGRGQFIDYKGADAFTCGMLLHGAMCAGAEGPPLSGPFAPNEEPRHFEDAMYQEPPNGDPGLKVLVQRLLHIGVEGRLSAADALAQVKTMNAERRAREAADREREREIPMYEENEGKGDDGDDDMAAYEAAVPLSASSLAITAQIDAENAKGADMDFAWMGQLVQTDLPAARALDIQAYKAQVVLEIAANEAQVACEAQVRAIKAEYPGLPLGPFCLKIVTKIDAEKAKGSAMNFAMMDQLTKTDLPAARALEIKAHETQVAYATQKGAMEAAFPGVPLSPFCLKITAKIDAEKAKGSAMNFAVMDQLTKADLPAARALDIAANEAHAACAARKANLDAQLAAAMEAKDYGRCGVLQGEAKEAAAQLEAATDARAKEWAASKWLERPLERLRL
jgi:hypothetical protein